MINCNFCGNELVKGTGKLYIQKDGKIFYFCSSKCQKNMLVHRKKPLQVKWTKVSHDVKINAVEKQKEVKPKNKVAKKK